jgi:hypothetical protein
MSAQQRRQQRRGNGLMIKVQRPHDVCSGMRVRQRRLASGQADSSQRSSYMLGDLTQQRACGFVKTQGQVIQPRPGAGRIVRYQMQ